MLWIIGKIVEKYNGKIYDYSINNAWKRRCRL